MKAKDEICEYCRLKNKCSGSNLCAPLDWIDGKTSRKEVLIRDLSKSSGEFYYKNYNDTLAELIIDAENRTEKTIEKIKQLLLEQDYRTRLIGAGLMFLIPQKKLAALLHISEGRLSQIIK